MRNDETPESHEKDRGSPDVLAGLAILASGCRPEGDVGAPGQQGSSFGVVGDSGHERH